MENNLEKLIKVVYKRWKKDQKPQQVHPDEEDLVCFLEGRLSQKENEQIKLHLINCERCIEAFAVNAKIESPEVKQAPQELIQGVKDLIVQEKIQILEIFLRIKEKTLELINTTGDVLWGEELVPAPILRSRSINDFKDEVIILKDFKDIRVEAKIENKAGKTFNLIIIVRQKETQKVLKDLRVTLLKDDLELESCLTDSGSVTFEHILLGKYRVEISSLENKVASVLLDIRT
jgi:hypothetical protein